MVVLKGLPSRFLEGLPRHDQRVISERVGSTVRLRGYDHGRLELEFTEPDGTLHFIYVSRRYVDVAEYNSKKSTKRRK